jgi:hypothetical protein
VQQQQVIEVLQGLCGATANRDTAAAIAA